MTKAILINYDYCTGCHSCEVACKNENGIALGEYWNRVLQIGPHGTFPDLEQYWLPVQCQQCEDAPCVHVCPTGASYRDADGKVLVDKEKCIGCKYCMAACPYGARIQIKATGVVEKCRFCWEDGEPGNPPACVGTCISGTRIFGDLDDPDCELVKEIAATHAAPIAGDLTKSKVYYVR